MSVGDFSKLKYQIQIQDKVVEIDENGFPQEIWQTIRTTRADIKTNSNSKSEKVKVDGTSYFPRKEFIIRKLGTNIHNGCRIVYKNNLYNIIIVEDLDEDGMFIYILGEQQ